MKVLVTGGTGFVGSHAVSALVKRGHEVRILARSPERAASALRPLGVDGVEVVRGDAGDAGAVRAASRGMDAVLHAAAVFSFDSRAARRVGENANLARVVLGAGAEMGLDPLVYVSSYLALVPPREPVLRPDSPVGTATLPYARSKAEAEVVARELQARGAPVVSIYPGGVWGPHDPNFGEQARTAANILKGRTNIALPGGYAIVDVRDLTEAMAAAFVPGQGPRRYMISGTYLSFVDLVKALGTATGRKIPVRRLPMVLAVARIADVLQRALPVRLPWNFEGAHLVTLAARCDDSLAASELGFSPRNIEETVRDTVRWLLQAGHISPAQAGRLAEAEG